MFHVKQVYKIIYGEENYLKNIHKYEYHVFFCTNIRNSDHPRGCCANKGSLKLRNIMKAKIKQLGLKSVRINVAGCLDSCEEGPSVVIYPEGVWYSVKTENDVEDLMEIYVHHIFVFPLIFL